MEIAVLGHSDPANMGKGEILKDLTPDEAVKAIVDKLAAEDII